MQQRLRRYAAHVQTGPAQPVPLFHTGDLHPELSRPNGGDIAARAPADHDEIVAGLWHRVTRASDLEHQPLGILDRLFHFDQEGD